MVEGGHWQFLGRSDGDTTNPRHILVTSDTSNDTLFKWVADSTGGIDGTFMSSSKIYAGDGELVVEGASRFAVPSTGVYMVKIGTLPARKIVVVR